MVLGSSLWEESLRGGGSGNPPRPRPRPPFPRLSPVAQPRVRTGFPDLVLEGGDGWTVRKSEKARKRENKKKLKIMEKADF